MGKYASNSRQQQGPPRNRSIHPVVRGVGCLLMVIIPIFSYAAAVALVNVAVARGVQIPPNWLGVIQIPPALEALTGLRGLWGFLRTQPNLIANLIFAVLLTVLIGSLLSVVYGYIYSMVGPSQYGPQDVPPPRVKTKKYTR